MSIAVELWRVLEAWDPVAKRYRIDRGLPGAGRFVSGSGGGGGDHKPSLAHAVKGTAAGGPKRQRSDKGGMSVADAVRKAARTSDTTGRPTQHEPGEHRAHGAHDVADEVERALADMDLPDSTKELIAAHARVAAAKHGPRPESLPRPNRPKAAPKVKATQAEVQGDIHDAVHAVQREPGAWVGLADLRAQLGDRHSKAEVDDALRGMLSTPGVRVIPVANLKALEPRDREAAVRIGGEDSHMMAIDPSTSRPGTAKAEAPAASAAPAAPVLSQAERVAAAKVDIYDSVKRLQAQDEAWVSLRRLRNDLGDRHDRQDVDKALDELSDNRGFELEPEANQKVLTVQDRQAALKMGGEYRHLVQIGKHFPRPSGKAPEGVDEYERGARGAHVMTGKSAWDALLAGPQKEQRPEGRKWTDAELAADRKKVTDRTAVATAAAGPRANVFNDPAFAGSTGMRKQLDEARAARDGAQAARDDAQAKLADALRTARSRDDARKALAALNVRELRSLADRVGVKPGSKATKAKLLDTIVDHTAGRRLDSEALNRPPPAPSINPAERVAAAKGDIRKTLVSIAGYDKPIGLAELRERLGSRYSRDEVDRALTELSMADDVSVYPESNQKALTQAERDARVRIGNQDKHIIAIYKPF